tara:strand:- start:3119 stop:3616 length:498 start_codon:yes stop_codon:yes gene_type:complete
VALIIEDGSIVPNANSFVTAAEMVTYAALRGVTISADTTTQEQQIILAMDYLIGREQSMKGTRVSDIQELPYPRFNVRFNGYYIEDSEIPKELKNAQIELAIQVGGSELLISKTTENVASVSLDGVISKSYFNGGSWSTVRTDKADAYLDVLLNNGGRSNLLTRI